MTYSYAQKLYSAGNLLHSELFWESINGQIENEEMLKTFSFRNFDN